MFKIGDRIMIKVPSIACNVYPDLVGKCMTIRRIDEEIVSGGGRWLVVDEVEISGLHERDVVMAHGPCPMLINKDENVSQGEQNEQTN